MVEHVATGKHAVASYLHTTARLTAEAPADPQLRNCNIVLNMNQRDDDAYRSTESLYLFQLRLRIASVYHQELAFDWQQLGYSGTFASGGI